MDAVYAVLEEMAAIVDKYGPAIAEANEKK
jgi:hypothetical protein